MTSETSGWLDDSERMPEAEVTIRLAEYLLSLPHAASTVEVAIDGASAKVQERHIFRVSEFLQSRRWQRTEQGGKNSWACTWVRDGKQIVVHSKPGRADVVVQVGNKYVRAECKKGPLHRKKGSPERPLLTLALGQALLIDAPDDVIVAAVPNTPAFRSIAAQWRERPLVRRSQIQICLVGRDGSVSGLDVS